MPTELKNTNDIEEGGEIKEPPRHWLRATGVFFIELVKVGVLAALTIGMVRYFIFKPFIVHGASMSPNFYENEYLIIDEISYRFSVPDRGEILVLRNPSKRNEFFLKRAVGLPGERILIEDGSVTIFNENNSAGTELKESYLPPREFTPGQVDVTLAEEEYYVMGDNRDASYDSRMFGPIEEDQIIGRVLLRGWPFDRAQRFSVPEYNL